MGCTAFVVLLELLLHSLASQTRTDIKHTEVYTTTMSTMFVSYDDIFASGVGFEVRHKVSLPLPSTKSPAPIFFEQESPRFIE